MAILDNIQAVGAENQQFSVNKDRVANSIRFRQESVKMTKSRYVELMEKIAQREELVDKLKEKVNQDVESNVSYNAVIGKNFPYAAKIAVLEEEINILGAVSGPMELVGNRAIRLIDKMYKETMASSEGIYAEQLKKADMFKENDVVPSIDVQRVAENNKEQINESLESAISEEKSLENNVIKEESVVIPSFDNTINKDEMERIINEKIENFANEQVKAGQVLAPVNDTVVEIPQVATISTEPVVETSPVIQPGIVTEPVVETSPVIQPGIVTEPVVETSPVIQPGIATEPVVETSPVIQPGIVTEPVIENSPVVTTPEFDITKENEDNMLSMYYELNNEAEKKEKEVMAVNEAKGFEFEKITEPVTVEEPVIIEESIVTEETKTPDEQIRDEIITVPDRPETVIEKENDKYDTAELAEPVYDESIVDAEPIEAKSIIMPVEGVEKLREERIRQLQVAREANKKLAEEYSSVDLDIENQRELNAKMAEEEAAAEKKLDESKAEVAQANIEFDNTIAKHIAALENENENIRDGIKSKNEMLASIKEDTESKRKNIESLNKNVESNNEEAARIREQLSDMVSELDDQDTFESVNIKRGL